MGYNNNANNYFAKMARKSRVKLAKTGLQITILPSNHDK